MADLFYLESRKSIVNGEIDLMSDTNIKVMLVNNNYTEAQTHQFVAAGGANDPDDAEITATNYTRGYGGAGRKTLANGNKTLTVNSGSSRVEFDYNLDLTWTALGGAVNDTIYGAILIKEGTADDTTSRLIAYFDFSAQPVPTNGGDVSLAWNSAGILHF